MLTTAEKEAARPYLAECIKGILDQYAGALTDKRRIMLGALAEAYMLIDPDRYGGLLQRVYAAMALPNSAAVAA